MIVRRIAMDKGLAIRVLLAAGMILAQSAPAGAQDSDDLFDAPQVTAEQVADAVQRGLAYLRQHLRGAGGRGGGFHQQGTRALILLAMLNAGISADDPLVVQHVAALDNVPNQHTYTVALKCQVYAAAGPEKYKRRLAAAANWLVRAQLDNGMWTYTSDRRRGRGDNSNTQFALLGLHEAAKAGIPVPDEVWQRSRKHFENTQIEDGGWTYHYQTGVRLARGTKSPSYGSMTAAGVASLYICGQRLHVGGAKRFVDGAYPDCGKYRRNKVIAKGLEWLAESFSVRENPGRGGSWVHYYLYALERVGMISGLAHMGWHDWYREGAGSLIATQRREDGSWSRTPQDTAFALLFLCKGNRPVLIQKLHWKHPTQPNEWNRNINDLDHLTAFIGDKFGKPTTWQAITLDAPLTDLRISPVLLITGHEFPSFTAQERQKLRDYVESGGTLLFEACCGSEHFCQGFRAFAATVYKEAGREYKLRKLSPDHPVFRSFYAIDDPYGLEGIDIGCKTGVFFSPNALCCLWELRDYVDPLMDRRWSETALKLGTNIAAYATGKEQLVDKLTRIELPEAVGAAGQPEEVPRGAVRMARLVHSGDYNADPHAMVNLAGLLRDKANVDVVAKAKHLRATDEEIYDYPVLFMTGHHAFTLSDEEIAALRKYLQRGGFLFADACCGRKEFDAGFREMARRLFPGGGLKPLAADHPLYGDQLGGNLGELRYRTILAEERKKSGAPEWRGTTRPSLEGVEIDGRSVILYSKYDYSCALEGDKPYSCRGYVDPDGRKLALKIVLYAIAY